MVVFTPLFLVQLFCAWFQCEVGPQPPYIRISLQNTQQYLKTLTGRSGPESRGFENGDPIAYTTLGPVQGNTINISNGRRVYSFTGIPYGEKPGRFRDPVPKNPWQGIWQAKSPSPFCIQTSPTLMGSIRGQEDCLYLDVHTPRLPNTGSKKPGMPVLIWIPAGANIYGRSRVYGAAYILQEDIVFVPINVRFGVYGFLSTGDEASPGNFALKDESLAIKWVHDNIEAFGGDSQKIIVGGISSGAYAAHMMLFTRNEARKYVSGIIAISGTAFGNHGLDTRGRVREASNMISKHVGCPTSEEGKSKEMVECLRKIDPYFLSTQASVAYKEMPPLSKMLGPTLEPDLPNAFISELPEVLYEQGKVPPIPVIFTRAEDEISFMMSAFRPFLPILGTVWNDWMPKFFQIGMRSNKGKIASFEESQVSLIKVNKFYFNKTSAPRFLLKNRNEYIAFTNMMSDAMYNAPSWKAIQLHHKLAPTYMYINKHRTFSFINPLVNLYTRIFLDDFGSSHANDYVLLFNHSKALPPLSKRKDFETASKNLINMIYNFGVYSKPLYRTPNGELLDVWKPIENMKRPMVLEVGLVHNISMIRDPLPRSGRMEIWDELKW